MKDYIKYPVEYEFGYFWDNDHHMIAQMRGWGWLQKLPNAEEKQDEMGQFIADAINEKLKPHS